MPSHMFAVLIGWPPGKPPPSWVVSIRHHPDIEIAAVGAWLMRQQAAPSAGVIEARLRNADIPMVTVQLAEWSAIVVAPERSAVSLAPDCGAMLAREFAERVSDERYQ